MAKFTGTIGNPSVDAAGNKIVKPIGEPIDIVFYAKGKAPIIRKTAADGKYDFTLANGSYQVSMYLSALPEAFRVRADLRDGEFFVVATNSPTSAFQEWLDTAVDANKPEDNPIIKHIQGQLDAMQAILDQFRDETSFVGTGNIVRESITNEALKYRGNIPANSDIHSLDFGIWTINSNDVANALVNGFDGLLKGVLVIYKHGSSQDEKVIHYYSYNNTIQAFTSYYSHSDIWYDWVTYTPGKAAELSSAHNILTYKSIAANGSLMQIKNINDALFEMRMVNGGEIRMYMTNTSGVQSQTTIPHNPSKNNILMSVGDFGIGTTEPKTGSIYNQKQTGFYSDQDNTNDSIYPSKNNIHGYAIPHIAGQHSVGIFQPLATLDAYTFNQTGRYAKILTDVNTIIDSNGNYKPASPVVQLHHDRVEYNEDFDKDNPPQFEHLETGVYRITNVREICKDGWTFNKPRNGKDQPYFMIKYEQENATTLLVRVFERTFDKNTGEFGFGEPRDIGENERWIDFHFEVDHERIAREEAQMQKEQEEFEEQERLRKEAEEQEQAEATAAWEAEMARHEAEMLAEMEAEHKEE